MKGMLLLLCLLDDNSSNTDQHIVWLQGDIYEILFLKCNPRKKYSHNFINITQVTSQFALMNWSHLITIFI